MHEQYPNMLQLFEDLKIQDRLQWKRHSMIFAMPGVSAFCSFESYFYMSCVTNIACNTSAQYAICHDQIR